jgi:hypothetical protein
LKKAHYTEPDQEIEEESKSVRTSFWNFLTFIFVIAGVTLAGVFLHVYNDPYSDINPFPPPTQISIVNIPTLTASPQALPVLWTATPVSETVSATIEVPTQTDDSEIPSTPEPAFAPIIIDNSQADNSSRKVLILPTITTGSKAILPQVTATEAYQPEAREPASSIVITAPVGVFSNTWQKMQSIPSFSWRAPDILQEIKNYRVYFNSNMDGKPTAEVTKTNYSHPGVSSGEYFLRIEAVGSNGAVLETSQVFVFKYDNTPPTEPDGFGTLDPPTTVTPFFSWMPSSDAHSGMEGGLAGYAIYQGPIQKCGKPVAFTMVNQWTPVTPLVSGTTEYFCVKALDAVGNESKWVGPIPFLYYP